MRCKSDPIRVRPKRRKIQIIPIIQNYYLIKTFPRKKLYHTPCIRFPLHLNSPKSFAHISGKTKDKKLKTIGCCGEDDNLVKFRIKNYFVSD